MESITRVNPDTSLQAYHSMDGKILAEHYQRILSTLKMLNTAIYEEIATAAGFTDKNQVSRRLKELEIMELVYKTGTKGLTKSNRQAYHYKLRSADTIVPEMENKVHEEIVPAYFASLLVAGTKQGKLVQQSIFENEK